MGDGVATQFWSALGDLALALRSPDPEDRVVAIRTLTRRIREFERVVVREANAAGVSWEAIGAEYGITRQAAHRRFAEVDDG